MTANQNVTPQWFYRTGFAKQVLRSLRTFDRMRHKGLIPPPDGKDATGHHYWLAATVESAKERFLGRSAA